ncbi:MAG: fluoride efflux transporter CrcB [Solirubrobacteraceae bacterium]|nr:fluoride efflux transporter CrcB [Solirubrobacteraceae bacterium]
MSGPLLLLVGLLGGAGACARFVVDAAITARAARGRRFPLGILAVNLGGAFALGVAVGATLHGDRHSLIATGLLGSYTTFSTWMFDSHRLARDGRGRAAALNLGASLVLGLLAVWLGRALGEAF